MAFTLAQRIEQHQNNGSALAQVWDEVLPDPVAYRAAALALPYGDVTAGHDTFSGIAPTDNPLIVKWIQRRYPDAIPTLNFFRKSPRGQREPNYIHSDAEMGDWTAILYLNPDPPEDDGTWFWRRLSDNVRRGSQDEVKPGEQWIRWNGVRAKFGRLLLFESSLFHSRGLEMNYGVGDDARLIQVCFGRCE